MVVIGVDVKSDLSKTLMNGDRRVCGLVLLLHNYNAHARPTGQARVTTVFTCALYNHTVFYNHCIGYMHKDATLFFTKPCK